MPLRELLPLIIREGKRRLLGLAILFGVVAVGVLAAGLVMPKRWDATTLLVTDTRSIIKPLLDGRAVPTTIADQMPIVTQVMGSRRILREIAAFGGWTRKPLNPKQEDRLLAEIKGRIKLETTHDDAVRISYHDSDAKRAYLITNKLAEILIRESSALKENQSREAFEFIARRVEEYSEKLTEAQKTLLAHYRRGEDGAGLGAAPSSGAVPAADEEPRRPRISPEELASLRAEEATLKAQLGGKKGAAPADSRQLEDQYRSRVVQLQADLERLRSRYTDQHPDVVHLQRELKSAQDDLAKAEALRRDREQAAAQAAALDDDVTRAAAARLDQVQQKIAAATGVPRHRGGTLRAAVAVNPNTLTGTDLEMKGVGQDTVLSELVRSYEATRDVYQDLLKRRENARVSMDLDAEHRGMVLRVQEAAEMPVVSTSVRLLYVALGGLVLATALPLGLLVAMVQLDPRIRSAERIERAVRLPLLVAIPSAPVRRTRTDKLVAASIVVGVFILYAATFVVKQTSS